MNIRILPLIGSLSAINECPLDPVSCMHYTHRSPIIYVHNEKI